MRASLLLCLAAVVLFDAAPVNAELFNCKDERGRTVIQNMPCDGARVTEPVPQRQVDPFGEASAAYQRGDYAQAIRLWWPMAERGNAQAQYHVGVMYANGYGVKQDHQEAAKWWQLAAAQGSEGAQNFLGFMYANGYGVAQSDHEAMKWWQLAAAQGNAQAQNSLNALYEKAQAGRDLLAPSTPTTPAATQAIVSQPGINLFAPAGAGLLDPLDPPQTTSPRGSILNRAIVGGISGALIGALAGLFILVRALVKKYKAPATAEAMAIYRDRPQAIKIGAALLIGCTALLVYLLVLRTHTVDDYLNDYQGRLEKLRECGDVPDMTKDRECMNAYTAQRMFMIR